MATKEKTVLVFGTFDGIHDGHRHFLASAKALGTKLVISVADDVHVRNFKKSDSFQPQTERIAELQKEKLADVITPGDKVLGNWTAIREFKPNIVALGYDQEKLGEALQKNATSFPFPIEIIKIPAYKGEILHSSILKAKKS